jgi:hypothetical protein
VGTYGAPDYSDTVLEAKICTNFNEHSLYIKFLCLIHRLYCDKHSSLFSSPREIKHCFLHSRVIRYRRRKQCNDTSGANAKSHLCSDAISWRVSPQLVWKRAILRP